MEKIDETVEFFSLSLGAYFNSPAAGKVSHVAREAQSAGVPFDKVAEVDALDAPVHGGEKLGQLSHVTDTDVRATGS